MFYNLVRLAGFWCWFQLTLHLFYWDQDLQVVLKSSKLSFILLTNFWIRSMWLLAVQTDQLNFDVVVFGLRSEAQRLVAQLLVIIQWQRFIKVMKLHRLLATLKTTEQQLEHFRLLKPIKVFFWPPYGPYLQLYSLLPSLNPTHWY